MEDIERLRVVVFRFDPEDPPSPDEDPFRLESVRLLAFSLYNGNRDQREEPWLSNGDAYNGIRILFWLKKRPDLLYPS